MRMFAINRFAMTIAKTALTLVFIAFAMAYAWARKDELLSLHWPPLHAVLIVAIAYVFNVYLTSAYNVIIARRLGADLAPSESFMLSAVVAAGNFLLPIKAGAGVRALYMRKVHDFPISYFVSGALIFVLVSMIFVALVAVLLLGVIYLRQGYFRSDLSILFPLAAFLAAVGLLTMRRNGERTAGDERSWFESFRGSLFVILSETKLVLAALMIVSMIFLVASLVWTVALREYASEITILEAFLLTASQIISGFITLTPGATGFQEIAALYVGQSFMVTTTELFAVLIWVRIVRIITAIAVAVPSAWFLRERLRTISGTALKDLV